MAERLLTVQEAGEMLNTGGAISASVDRGAADPFRSSRPSRPDSRECHR
jgi:hypothetical protein